MKIKKKIKYVYNSNNINIIKAKYRLTSVDLSKILDMNQNSIVKYCRGRVTLRAEQIAIICNAINEIVTNDKDLLRPKDFYDVTYE